MMFAPKKHRQQDLPMIGKKGRNLPILGKSPKAGFSLLELSAVLLILAVVTMLASREISKQQHQLRYEKSNQLLEDIQIAIIGDRWEKDDIKRSFNFVSDMGRLPRAVQTEHVNKNDNRLEDLTLRELFVMPDDATVFGRYSANNRHADAAAHHDLDDDVTVMFGWRGPYMRVPVGGRDPFLYDGWGNAFVSLPGTLSSTDLPNRLLGEDWISNKSDKASEGMDILAIRHLGANALVEDDNDDHRLNPYNRDEVRTNHIYTLITGSVIVPTNISGATDVEIRLYGPGTNDTVMIWRTNAAYTVGMHPTYTMTNDNITHGARVLRAGVTDALGTNHFSVPMTVYLHADMPTNLMPDIIIREVKYIPPTPEP